MFINTKRGFATKPLKSLEDVEADFVAKQFARPVIAVRRIDNVSETWCVAFQADEIDYDVRFSEDLSYDAALERAIDIAVTWGGKIISKEAQA